MGASRMLEGLPGFDFTQPGRRIFFSSALRRSLRPETKDVNVFCDHQLAPQQKYMNIWNKISMNYRMPYFGGLIAISASILALFQGIRVGALDSPECLVLLALYFVFLGYFFLALRRNQTTKLAALRSQFAGLRVGGSHHLTDGLNDPSGIPI